MEKLQDWASIEDFHGFCGMADWKLTEQIEEKIA